ncbi:MAG: hypothetical protein ABI379_03050, partial [Rhodanobacter sp.]
PFRIARPSACSVVSGGMATNAITMGSTKRNALPPQWPLVYRKRQTLPGPTVTPIMFSTALVREENYGRGESAIVGRSRTPGA